LSLSVVIPVHNGGEDLRRCLAALAKSRRLPDEIIVVDDASTDASAAIAGAAGALVLPLAQGPNGPAVARNRGAAQARGDLVLFLDADVAAHDDTLERIERYMAAQPDVAALFGSYDDNPAKPGIASRYKNLLHHYVHQHGRREAGTFWAGCGAVRRDVFARMGGFDTAYGRPSIEDIELGVRLRRAGYRVWLCADVQVTHLKRWTIRSLLRSDIRDRAIPWTQLILRETDLPADLNLDAKSRLSAVVAWLLVGLLAAGLWLPALWLGVVAALALLGVLNADLYTFFWRRGGWLFTVGAIALHILYYLYSSFIFGSMLVWHVLGKVRRRASAHS
jgi:GT2 family glycosyltransferase